MSQAVGKFVIMHEAGWQWRNAYWLLLSGVVLLLDQVTKLWVSAELALYQSIEVTSFFNIRLAHNTGAAFSMLSEAGGWQRWFFTVLAVLVCGLLLWWLVRLERGMRATAAGYALIIGGALGNVWDRVCYGYVVDFLDFHWAGWHYPTFNIADAAITLGATLLLLDVLRAQRQADQV